MSGTSLDGLDIAYIKFQSSPVWNYEFLFIETVEYTAEWQNKLQFRSSINKKDLNNLDHEYGEYLGLEINKFRIKNNIEPAEIDLIASHGHTIFHKPELGFTKQIGNGPEIFSREGIPVVCDFRVQDLKLGGQGAPLVPIGDHLLFSEYGSCINLGGFANISYEMGKKRLAMDICPLNFVSNNLVKPLDLNFDDKGEIAKSGQVNLQILESLNNLEFYNQNGPKTLGAEWVETNINPIILKSDLEIKDILRTFTEHASEQISEVLKTSKSQKALFTGGGVYNEFLIELIKEKSNCEIVIPKKDLIEFKEALIFGLLGVLRVLNKVNVLASVTGASADHCSGRIYN